MKLLKNIFLLMFVAVGSAAFAGDKGASLNNNQQAAQQVAQHIQQVMAQGAAQAHLARWNRALSIAQAAVLLVGSTTLLVGWFCGNIRTTELVASQVLVWMSPFVPRLAAQAHLTRWNRALLIAQVAAVLLVGSTTLLVSWFCGNISTKELVESQVVVLMSPFVPRLLESLTVSWLASRPRLIASRLIGRIFG